jgi:hypothetical protein
VPVTAKLSRRFYEQFGDELTNELVEWFNAVDTTYRSDLRETNTANFARFDARLRQSVAELDARIDRRYTELDAKIDRRYTELDAKIDQRYAELDAKIDQRYTELDAKIDQRFGALDAKMDHGFALVDHRFGLIEQRFVLVDQRFLLIDQRFDHLDAKIDTKIDQRTAELRENITASIAASESRMLRWMFTLWTSSMLSAAGLFVAIIRFR